MSQVAHPKKVVLLHDPENDPEEGALMEFRLTYDGPLRAAGRDDNSYKRPERREHKHDLRRVFHLQLRRLWETTPFLKSGGRMGQSVIVTEESEDAQPYDVATLAARHRHFDRGWVPLVTKSLGLMCGLDILFLRSGIPGSVVAGGDLDNRIKTLIDALAIPDADEDYSRRPAAEGEDPMYVLLENDVLVTKLSVETDQILQPSAGDVNDVRLVITVRVRPYVITLGNVQFG